MVDVLTRSWSCRSGHHLGMPELMKTPGIMGGELSWVENSELGQDEGGQTTGTLIIVGLCLALISALHNSPTSASAMLPGLMQGLAEDPQNTSE